MKHKISSILVCSLFSVASCMQAEKVSLDTSGAEGLLLSGLSIELGLFGGSGGGSCSNCYMFAATASHNGDFSPFPAGADTLCMSDPKYPGSGTFRAMLVDGVNRIATMVGPSSSAGQYNWVFKPNTNYYYIDALNTIQPVFTSNSAGLSMTVPPFGNFGSSTYWFWSGMNADWTVATSNCTQWTTTAGNGTYALGGNGGAYSYSCSSAVPFLCVEQ